MDKSETKRSPNPRQKANLISVIFFKWLLGTFRKGYNRALDETDVYSPLDEYSSEFLGNKIGNLWDIQQERCKKLNVKSRPSLLKVLAKCFGWEIVFLGILMCLSELILRTFQPIILVNSLKYFGGSNSVSQKEAIYWASALIGSIFLNCLIYHSVCQSLTLTGMKVRIACCSLIYRKILKVPQVSLKNNTSSIGQVIDFLSNEVFRLDRAVITLNYMWIAPIQTCIVTYVLYKEIDIAVTGGTIFIPIFMLIFVYYKKFIVNLTRKLVCRTDARLKLTNEIINGIKIVKMYAWEKPFSKFIHNARKEEIKIIKKRSIVTEIFNSIEKIMSRMSLFLTILLYILFGNNVKTQKVYLIAAYYNILHVIIYRLLIKSIKDFSEALTAVRRIRNFLLIEYIKQESLTNSESVNWQLSDNIALSLQNVTVKWDPKSRLEILKNINLEIKTGYLTAIVGEVGSGKSTLFQAIMSEVSLISGKIKVNGKISYCSQEPWIFTSSIKQNILFGQPMNAKRYAKVITVCQLRRDFSLLPRGENTLIGEKGVKISAGQRARINLARAIYRNADIYLLDDVLPAVDAHVSKAIFRSCLRIFLRSKTVIVTTQQLQYLKDVDEIVILKDGAIREKGTYDELVDLRLGFAKFSHAQVDSSDEISSKIVPEIDCCQNNTQPFNEEEQERLEHRRFASITVKTYKQYFKAAENWCLVFLVFFLTVLCQVLSTSVDCFIAYWVNIEDRGDNFTVANNDPLRGRSSYIYIYGSVNVLILIFMLVQVLSYYTMCARISRNLHTYMLNSISYTIIDFFHSNPIGRIMKRFSKDIGAVDTEIPQILLSVLQTSTYFLAVIIIATSVNPWLILPIIVFITICYYLRLFYIKTIRSVKRLERITQSSILNHVSASCQGLTTIRALKTQKILTKEFDNHQDLHSSAWFLYFSGSRALGFYVELLTVVLTAIIVYTLLFFDNSVMPGNVGLIITQFLLLIDMMQYGIRQTTELESHMISVERILDYSKLPMAAADEVVKEAPNDWPRDGRIVFDNVSLIYNRQDKPTLKNLNFTIEPNEMIGIVGKIGAGKFSIVNALFRLANIEGSIYIDDVSTSSIALQDLRSRISVVPQEPLLFSGTIRRNLDPFDEYKDSNLWQALEDVELKSLLNSDFGLYMQVMEGGSNFSIGQRQLLCLARAIVRNNKILILNEATAYVDSHTDKLIQKVIRRKFNNCTILVIAHRLHTIIDSCKILVMDAGEVVEFDHPFNLLKNKNGVFFNMVQQLGNSMADNFFEMAKFNYEIESVRL